ncbi:hypothetical protein [Arthrobacter sp. ov118]|uniref:hypothetical protein n=1 Tax=Arthrobacter sp. ov118 TaxID=1761747 RepID=UPI000B829FE2|nr:hypothetical protein [Arthrobacter sp. ov118]
MLPPHRAPFVAALAAAAALALSGCGAAVAGGSASPAAAPSAPASAASAPEASGPPATAGPSPVQASAPAAADLATYSFPDGHVSFKYPAGWRVELFTAGKSPFVGTATVYDAGGVKQATIYSGKIADGVTNPVTRTVFESAPVPGLQGQPAPQAQYAFYVDRVNDNAKYRMHLCAGAPIAGAEMALDGIIRTATGVLVADVEFIEKPFAGDDAAKTWLAGAEGQALKTLLLSISYR